MKGKNTYKALVMFCMLCMELTVCAQGGGIMVSYQYRHPVQTMRNAEPDITNHYILVTDGVRSKFYSPQTEYIDSIESTPEGFEKFNTFKRVCYEKKQQDLIPRVDGSFYITKNFTEKKIGTYDVASGTRFKWVEPLGEMDWDMMDSTKNIMDYDCFKAQTVCHGRHWTVWFTPEIPVADGPWKLYGLPGTILEAECEGGQYRFIATGLQTIEDPYYDIYSERNWEPITGPDFWQLRRSCLDNPSRNMGANPNVIVYKGVEYKKYLPKDIVDYIETDY